jgi:hypothetical protein
MRYILTSPQTPPLRGDLLFPLPAKRNFRSPLLLGEGFFEVGRGAGGLGLYFANLRNAI